MLHHPMLHFWSETEPRALPHSLPSVSEIRVPNTTTTIMSSIFSDVGLEVPDLLLLTVKMAVISPAHSRSLVIHPHYCVTTTTDKVQDDSCRRRSSLSSHRARF